MGIVTPLARPERTPGVRESGSLSRLLSFGVIGGLCTVAFALLYTFFRGSLGPLPSNLLALSLTMVLNFEANRRFTFGSPRGSIGLQALGYGVAYLVGLAASTVSLELLLAAAGHPGRAVETLLALVAGLTATLVRFVLLSTLVFSEAGAEAPAALAKLE